MAEPTIDDMAENIIAAITKPAGDIKADAAHNNLNTDWNSALDQPIKAIADQLIRK